MYAWPFHFRIIFIFLLIVCIQKWDRKALPIVRKIVFKYILSLLFLATITEMKHEFMTLKRTPFPNAIYAGTWPHQSPLATQMDFCPVATTGWIWMVLNSCAADNPDRKMHFQHWTLASLSAYMTRRKPTRAVGATQISLKLSGSATARVILEHGQDP